MLQYASIRELAYFFPFSHESKRKYGPEFHVTRGFDSRESESLFTSPPLDMAMHPPPTLARFISPLRPGICTFLNVSACRPPRGVL